jgi:kynureninase
MISFFKPTKKKFKILIDTPSFPSDKYAVQSQLKLHGLDPLEDLIEISTLKGNKCISNKDMLNQIESNLDNVAMMLISGVNYYTGQFYDLKSISDLAKEYNCIIGLDLAHAAGNVQLELHNWDIDFAAWCGYKYLNGGPGAPSGVFVNEKYHSSNLNRLEGWWGHDKETRFNPPNLFNPIKGAEAWQLSNPPILSMAALRSSIELFDNIGMDTLRKRSRLLTSYMENMICSINNSNIDIITPSESDNRGSQLSLAIHSDEKDIESFLKTKNIICDFRKPNVIRAAPCAFYNSYKDIYSFVQALKEL